MQQITTVHTDDYAGWLQHIRQRVAATPGPLFQTTARATIWQTYLAAFPDAQRQYHTCHACKQFLERFGALAAITEEGALLSPFWGEDAPGLYQPVAAALATLIRRARVTSVFLTAAAAWGTPETGPWTHCAVIPARERLYRGTLKTAAQASAEKTQDFQTVCRALADFSADYLAVALRILDGDILYRAAHVRGPAAWLYTLQQQCATMRGVARNHLVWRAIAAAPAGFCHPRSSMVGTLLEDIAAGLPFAEVARKFAEKMHPLRYQRPQAATTAGNIARAEEVVQTLGIAASLRRRFARLEEIPCLWTPTVQATQAQRPGGVFAHLQPKGGAPSVNYDEAIPPIKMTWEKFRRVVLPDAQQIDYFVARARANYAAVLTAVDPEAPPILQWDLAEARNPCSWYLYHGGSFPEQWGLPAGTWIAVTGIAPLPSQWGAHPLSHHSNGLCFFLDNARDSHDGGLALFPEILKPEFREIRATIEAYSARGILEGREDASACGRLCSTDSSSWDVQLRVTAAQGRQRYCVDRWD